MPKVIDEPLLVRGSRFEVVTLDHCDVRGEPVPVTWSFADKNGAARLAKKHGAPMREVRRGCDAEDQE